MFGLIKENFIKNWRLIVLVALAFIVVTIGIRHKQLDKNDIVMDFDDQSDSSIYFDKDFWTKRINSVGPEKTYSEFKDYNEQEIDSTNTRHGLAHEFGVLLYATNGLDALRVCDSSFFFGCYHSFLGEAIADQGVGVITRMDTVCNEFSEVESFSCQHGIGHGLLSYYGYDRDILDEALATCALLTDKGPSAGCAGGVFMEYNFRTMSNPEGTTAFMREFDINNPHEPCLDIDKRFIGHCYAEQPNIWKHVFDWDYFKMGSLCNEAPDETLVHICINSLGYSTLINNEYEVEKTIDECMLMPDDKSKVTCLASAAQGMRLERSASLEDSLIFCSRLDGEPRKLCEKEIRDE